MQLYSAFTVSAPKISCITQGMSLYCLASSWLGSANTDTPSSCYTSSTPDLNVGLKAGVPRLRSRVKLRLHPNYLCYFLKACLARSRLQIRSNIMDSNGHVTWRFPNLYYYMVNHNNKAYPGGLGRTCCNHQSTYLVRKSTKRHLRQAHPC